MYAFGITECIIHHHSILHSIASGQGTHFTGNEVGHWAQARGIHWSDHVFHHLEDLARRRMEWCFKGPVTVPVRWQYLAGLYVL